MIGLESPSVPGGGGTPSRGPGPGGGSNSNMNGGGTTRERTMQAVEYYNSNVLRARQNAGLISASKINSQSSYNDRHPHSILHSSSTSSMTRRHHLAQDALYRSNSSLELQDHHHHFHGETNLPNGTPLRREYGSHGSIDVIGSDRPGGPVTGTSESFFAMLQDYRPAVLGVIGANDQRSPGPSEYLRGKVESPSSGMENSPTILSAGSSDNVDSILSDRGTPAASTSPKLKLKLHRLWGGSSNNNAATSNGSSNSNSGHSSSASKSHHRPHGIVDDSAVNTSTTQNSNSNSVGTSSADMEERQRRRAFAHYDCQSLTANLGYAAKLRGILLARRRNTTTGASAASMLTRSSTPDGDSGDEDFGDGQSNDLIESCPFFRNEIGGEEARVVSLTRLQAPGSQQQQTSSRRRPLHRPSLAYGVSVLEFPPGETHWRNNTCPYQRLSRPIESIDQGALYYRKYFCGLEHQNWFGMDDQLGPVAISIRRERVNPSLSNGNGSSDNNTTASSTSSTSLSTNNSNQYQYRLVIRTSELLTLRGAVLEDAIPNLKSTGSSKAMNTKEVLEYVAPEIQLSCLRLGVNSPQTEEQLLKLDEQGLTSHYKVGIMYCKAGQSSEEEMYNNEEAGPAFLEFLDTIGQRVRLKGFDKYKAGLDNKTDSTGTYSVYSQYQDCEIMFHVSTMLPFTPNNRQQLLRKRHIGNDIVTIVFQEPGAQPFTPKNIRSQFQHVFIIVRAVNPCSDNTQYLVAVSRSKEVPVFGPPIKDGAKFPKSKQFADFLLAKVINAENAAHRSEKFATMATRTRQEYLKDLATNYVTASIVDTGQKFSIFGGKKKEKPRPGFISDAIQRGAICWQVILDDSGQSSLVDCFLGISTDSLVLIEECSRQIVFVTPCKSILGWLAHASSLRIYHHQGECTTIHMRESSSDRDELMEIVARLRAVTQACPVQELSLRRNPMGQLGFHVQPDGVVTQVESMGLAWQAGLRQGARLVEICKIAVSTLSHDQMVDLLKTSVLVTVTVIPAQNDNTARRGCSLQNCKFNAGNYEGDYENVNGEDRRDSIRGKGAQLQQAVPGNHRRRYERSFSPPRSSNSSGYGTGSSSKSFHDPRFSLNPEGTMTSSSSGHSSDDRWYELLEPPENGHSLQGTTPPPLPARIGNAPNSAFQSVTPKQSIENVAQMSHSKSQVQISPKHQNTTSTPQHTKLHSTHSLPLSHGNYSLSTNNTPNHVRHIDFEHKISCLKTSMNDSRPLPRTANIEYLRTPSKTGTYSTENSTNHSTDTLKSDGHSTDTSSTSDRQYGLLSEDELSAGSQSGNVSPKLRRSQKGRTQNLTPSNSRNQSPRPLNNGETTRLRPGVTTRNNINRNSANLSSSTLQEDLMKLINPDYMMNENAENPQKTETKENRVKCRSRENINNSQTNHHQVNGNQTEVIFTTARPATVISNASTASSPALSEKKDERNSPIVPNNLQKKNTNFTLSPEVLPLPDAGEMDWPSLVDTATRAMLHVKDDSENLNASDACISETVRNGENLGHWVDDVAERLGLDASITSTIKYKKRIFITENL
ncbi:signal-induced proliferation-associated 1-like protein 1 isoform X2 [Chrysoperla carnea]|uniref:signal-induced proliferation-associated 1-like protein 1 isoform X2 n=1 Tax=Chrysoperla carnea TaxID=189513 RepID=UPI001D0605F7|nr:signal-induced proliferation-associated 1-like protein 1 isoform X2 [Chrysoperla carnea]